MPSQVLEGYETLADLQSWTSKAFENWGAVANVLDDLMLKIERAQ